MTNVLHLSARAARRRAAESYSQLLPGNTGMTTRGLRDWYPLQV